MRHVATHDFLRWRKFVFKWLLGMSQVGIWLHSWDYGVMVLYANYIEFDIFIENDIAVF